MARRAPSMLSKVRSISSSLDWVRTWIVTSSGINLSSMSSRTKSKSGCEEDGKPTSISLKPVLTRTSKRRRFLVTSIGSMSAWLPSRRSTLHQTGAAVIAASGQRRSGRSTGLKGRYFPFGIRFIVLGIPLAFVWSGRNERPPGSTDAGGLASPRRGARLRKEQLAGSWIQAHRPRMVPGAATFCPVAHPQAEGRASVGEHHAGGRFDDPGDPLDAGQDLPKLGQVTGLDRGDDVIVARDGVRGIHATDVPDRSCQGQRLAVQCVDEHVGPHSGLLGY